MIQVSGNLTPGYPSPNSNARSESSDTQSPQRKADASEAAQLALLQSTDTAVRAHEAAHLSAGGGVVTGRASFSYTEGPDGKLYAVGGEVPIDTSEESTPEATVAKARRIAAAALAPANPSGQDYRVASSAVMMEMRAKSEMMRETQNRLEGISAYAEAAQASA